MQSTFFAILRHGRTVWNQQRRIQGQTDTPLADEGREQARAWGRALARQGPSGEWGCWDAFLTSDLERAKATARLMNEALGLPMAAFTADPRLREGDWGLWTGMGVEELRTARAADLARQEAQGWDFRPEGGESRTEILERSLAALADAAAANPGGRVVVVTHQGVLKCLAYHLLGLRMLPSEPVPIEPYTWQGLAWDRDGPRLVLRNGALA